MRSAWSQALEWVTSTELLRAIDLKLGALVALHTHRLLLDDVALAKPRPRSIDRLLADVGLKRSEIGRILGKTPQAVGQALKRDGHGS